MHHFLRNGIVFLLTILSSIVAAQNSMVILGTGPGVAGAAETVTVSGTVLAVDLAKREVTLRGEDGAETVIEAAPDVKNLDKLAAGDRVDIEFTRALSLELRKGSTAEISRTDGAARELAEGGAKPGGVAGRRVVIMAEVTAINAETSTVTLRGPNKSIDLQVANPEQFARIAVGDRIEATYVEAVAVAVTANAAE